MQQLETICALREQLSLHRQAGKKIAFVPTMGNLHDGHIALVKTAQTLADVVVVSIFVNPIQFVAGEDFEHYPRTLHDDLQLLAKLSVAMVFMPSADEIYGDYPMTAEVRVPSLEQIYCGKSRPGHFQAVATIVTKLFNIVQPDLAVFGEKDYQQLLVIKYLVKTLDFLIDIIAVATVRAEDGLALSSRNQYLSQSERKQATMLYQCLCKVATAIKQGNDDYQALEQEALRELKDAGLRPDYFNICDPQTLKKPMDQKLVIICAAWLGHARLIDNITVQSYD